MSRRALWPVVALGLGLLLGGAGCTDLGAALDAYCLAHGCDDDGSDAGTDAGTDAGADAGADGGTDGGINPSAVATVHLTYAVDGAVYLGQCVNGRLHLLDEDGNAADQTPGAKAWLRHRLFEGQRPAVLHAGHGCSTSPSTELQVTGLAGGAPFSFRPLSGGEQRRFLEWTFDRDAQWVEGEALEPDAKMADLDFSETSSTLLNGQPLIDVRAGECILLTATLRDLGASGPPIAHGGGRLEFLAVVESGEALGSVAVYPEHDTRCEHTSAFVIILDGVVSAMPNGAQAGNQVRFRVLAQKPQVESSWVVELSGVAAGGFYLRTSQP